MEIADLPLGLLLTGQFDNRSSSVCFTNSLQENIIKVPLFLVQGGGGGVGSLHVHHQVLHLSLQPLLGLLQRRTLEVHGLHCFFCLLQMESQLLPVEQTNIPLLDLLGLLTGRAPSGVGLTWPPRMASVLYLVLH